MKDQICFTGPEPSPAPSGHLHTWSGCSKQVKHYLVALAAT